MNKVENMITLTFPDGNKKDFPKGVTGIQVAENISKSLTKEAIAVSLDGQQKDLSDKINNNSKISIITTKTDEGLEIMRHTLAAQVLALAVKNLFPKAKLGIGPTIENGFYYDVLFETPISSEDLPKIETEMYNIIKSNNSINKTIHSKEEAINFFKDRKEDYKIDIIKNSDQLDKFQIYKQENTEFIDLCYGPHIPSLKHIGSFKLTKIAGAYWKGNSSNEMLTRIYGTAWRNDKELKSYLEMLSEAEKTRSS